MADIVSTNVLKPMQHIHRILLYSQLISACFICLISCNSSSNETANVTDTAAVAPADSTISVAGADSLKLTFDMVLDSVYQRTPKKAFQALLAGHSRFLENAPLVYNSESIIPDSLARLKPYLVLTDIDLNQSVEKIFDLRRSMFIQLSTPACLVDLKQIAVMEYALNYSGTKVILVLSSSNSRMIGAAVDNVQTANFASITSELSQATKTAPEFADRSSANKDFVNNIAQSQSRLTLEKILQGSPQIRMLADSGKVVLKSAFYDAGKRTVTMLDREVPLNPSAKN